MIESRSSTQFFHLQPATNGNVSTRRSSLPDHSLSSPTLNCSPAYIKGGFSHRRASSDAAGSSSLACRAVQPTRFLERKGPKPFTQTPMSLEALQTCLTSLTPSTGCTMPEDEVQGLTLLESLHASRLPGLSQDQNHECSSRVSIYREESMMKYWLSRKPHTLAHKSPLQSIDDIKDDGEMCLPLDRMSLALFDFASTPNRPRTPPSNNAPLPAERNGGKSWRLVSCDSLSTLSISLDELLSEDDVATPSRMSLHDNNSAPSKNSAYPLIQDHTVRKTYASKPARSFASRSPWHGENPKYRSRLWDRKPKEMTLDLRLVSFKYLNTRSPSNKVRWWNSSETPSTDSEARRIDEKESYERGKVSIPVNAGEYPFPRMNRIEKKKTKGFVHMPGSQISINFE